MKADHRNVIHSLRHCSVTYRRQARAWRSGVFMAQQRLRGHIFNDSLDTSFNTLDVISSPHSAAYMRQWTGPSLVQVMACRLFGAKPLPEPMLAYCQLDSWEHISVKFESELYHFRSWKCIWKCLLPKWRPFCPGGDELKHVHLNVVCIRQCCL